MKKACIDREKLFAFSQQMLSGGEQQQVRPHLESCEECRRTVQSYQALDSVLDEWAPSAEPSPWFDARVRAAAEERENRVVSWLDLSWARWMAAPALASLLLVAGVVVLLKRPLPQRGPLPGAATAQVQALHKPPVAEPAASQELKMYQNLPVLEDYDMLTSFDVISELPKGSDKLAD